MKYVSLDIETTGINPKTDQILMVSMVLEDTDVKPLPLVENLPHLTFFVKHPRYEGNATALNMNAWILEEVSSPPDKRKNPDIPIIPIQNVEAEMVGWLLGRFGGEMHGKIPVAGKNAAGFDLQFFPDQLQRWFHYSVIDAGSVLIDWSEPRVKSLATLVKEYASEQSSFKFNAHNAHHDAMVVISCLRTSYPKE